MKISTTKALALSIVLGILTIVGYSQPKSDIRFKDIEFDSSLKIFSISIDSSEVDDLSLAYIFERVRSDSERIYISNSQTHNLLHKFLKSKKSFERESSKSVIKSLIVDRDEIDRVSIIASILSNGSESIYFKINNDRFSGYVYKAISPINNKSLGTPTLAIKHNRKTLEGWDIIENNSSRKQNKLKLLLTDSLYNTYYSNSDDGGNRWTHPIRGLGNLHSTNLFSSMHKSCVAIISKRVTEDNILKTNDIIIWKTKRSNLNNFDEKGTIYRVLNDPDNNSHWSISLLDKRSSVVLRVVLNGNKIDIEGYYIKLK